MTQAGSALLSEVATLEDVLFGFYRFLDEHPSEALLLSLKIDNTTWQSSERALEQIVYDLTTQGVGRDFWLQNDAAVRASISVSCATTSLFFLPSTACFYRVLHSCSPLCSKLNAHSYQPAAGPFR